MFALNDTNQLTFEKFRGRRKLFQNIENVYSFLVRRTNLDFRNNILYSSRKFAFWSWWFFLENFVNDDLSQMKWCFGIRWISSLWVWFIFFEVNLVSPIHYILLGEKIEKINTFRWVRMILVKKSPHEFFQEARCSTHKNYPNCISS